VAQSIAVTLSITLTQASRYRVVYVLRYAQASAASGFTIPRTAQLRALLQHFALTPEAIDQLLTSVQGGSPALLRFDDIDQDYAERVLRHYSQW